MFVTWEAILGRQLVYFILCLSLWNVYLLSGLLSFVGRSGELRTFWPS